MKDFRNKVQSSGFDSSYLLGLGLALVAVIALWWTPLLFPFRIFTTTVHEASHAFATIITGGQVLAFQVDPNGSGYIINRGGWGLLVSSAGYLGSTILGGLMLIWAKNEKGRRRLLYTLAGALMLVAVLFVVNIFNLFTVGVERDFFTLILVSLVAAFFGLIAYKGPDLLVSFMVYVTALLSTLYAVFDLINVVMINASPTGGHNDARNLERATGIPALLWALVWSVLAGFILWQTLKIIIRRGSSSATKGVGAATNSKPKSPFDSYDEVMRR